MSKLSYASAVRLSDMDDDMEDILDIFHKRARDTEHRMDVYGAMVLGELMQMEDCPLRTETFAAWVDRIRSLAKIA